MANRWNEDMTVKFMQLYREHENLWNMFNKDYRNREVRGASMKAIVEDMNMPNLTVKDVPKKIKALRSTYYLELGKIHKSKASGEGVDLIYKPSVAWFSDMDYIMKTSNLEENETSSNLELAAPWEAQDEINTSITSNTERGITEDFNDNSQPKQSASTPICDKIAFQKLPRARTKRKKRRLEVITDAVRDLKDLNEKIYTYPTTTSSVTEDECDIIGRHVAIQLRQLPTDERLRANLEIQKILMDFRLRNITNPPTMCK